MNQKPINNKNKREETNLTQPEISIIMPVYNVGEYIETSLNAIRQQTFKDWECVIVDDGSTDSSAEICDRFAKEDSRFKVIHQANGGVSKARNVALDNSRGKYIAFVDPDDWPDKNYLEIFHTLIKKYDADVVQCGFSREFTAFSRRKSLVNTEKMISREEAIPLLLDSNGIPSLLWTKLYKKEIITEKFPEGKTYEDAYTMPLWFRNANKIVLSPEITYHYRMRKGSITKIGIAENHYDFVMACQRLGSFVHEMVPGKFPVHAKEAYLIKIYVSGAKTIARKEIDKNKRREVIERISRGIKAIHNPGLRYLGIKIGFRSFMLDRHPLFFEKLMRGVNKLDFHAKRRKNHLFE